MTGIAVRIANPDDHLTISKLLKIAFGGAEEADLVDSLRRDGDVVLELVAVRHGDPVGHILFSRLTVAGDVDFPAVALAPLAVCPQNQRRGLGTVLVETAHEHLSAAGERLSVVLGDAAYYGRFGYTHARANGFESKYQGEHLQALAFGEAPSSGLLVYAPAFGVL
ncbi:MAG: N-acetyltransferase [Phyllobacterium sp.]|uniref:GNAT family N-acetyltransferase n=1 Tax=Phyllobacterium sp. TaxID=1871046 RepID=UPI0030F09903